MSIFRRVLVQNTVLFVIISLISAYIICFAFSQYAKQQQSHHLAQLQQLLELDKSTPKQVVKNLKSSFSYQDLRVERLSGEVEHQYQQDKFPFYLSRLLMQTFGLQTHMQTYANQLANLRITYILSQDDIYQIMDNLLYALVTLFFLFIFINTFTIRYQIKRILNKSIQIICRTLTRTQANEPENIAAHTLPKEFSSLALQLNEMRSTMTQQLKEWQTSAENYRHEATRDVVTGLPNRISFVSSLEEQINDEQTKNFGILAITRASELQYLNQNRGYEAGDQYICDLSQAIQRVGNHYHNALLFRLNGSDFALIIPNVTIKEAENFAKNLFGRFTELQKALETNSIGYTGIVAYEAGDSMGELLALADTGISLAQTKVANGWHIQNDKSILNNVSAKYGNQNWKQVIDDVLESRAVKLFYQPIQPTNKSSKVYSEILARFTNSEGDILPTASFVAMAEKMDKIIELDKLIIDATIQTIQQKNLNTQYFGINITAKSAHDEQFCVWLERRLLRDSFIASKLIFEASEFGLQQNMPASQRFIQMLHRTGARVTVERFGIGFTSFKFFRDIKPDFVKVDGSYSRGIDEDKNNQYFLRVVVDLAHRLGVTVIAESVETQEEKFALEQIFIDGTQGYFIGKPSEL
ncbi:EAL domain-containing protein [Catenovulum sediminis]|uniref:EAL domain-containing protein n=1 Tax=Catenovulum sediminis TaxID=1740262 RepID=A0ABV1RGJ9_9ALTE